MKTQDPVCGMEVDTEKAEAVSRYKEKDYYFCSAMCRKVFEQESEDLLKTQEEIDAIFRKYQTGESPAATTALPLPPSTWRWKAALMQGFSRQPLGWGTVAGALFGYLILHPYSMLAGMMSGVGNGNITGTSMLPMTVAFIIFGGALGGMGGAWWRNRLRQERERMEEERRQASLSILRQMMVTLSHYVTNSTTTIGGFARRGLAGDGKDRMVEGYLRLISAESDRIGVVIGTLNSLLNSDIYQRVEDEAVLMFKIQKEVTRNLETLAKRYEDSAHHRWGRTWEDLGR